MESAPFFACYSFTFASSECRAGSSSQENKLHKEELG